MFVATSDQVLPTTVTGSWPRPRWYEVQLGGRPLSTCMKDVSFREQYLDALAALLDDQERAGLDILTHGDYHLDNSIGGHHWLRYPLERWSGLEGDREKLGLDLPPFDPGRILNEVHKSARWPRLIGKVEPNEDNPLEYAKIWRLAQARAHKPVMFGTVSVQAMDLFLDLPGDPYGENDRHQLLWDVATAMNQELREVAAAGCTVIQVEDPLLHNVACFHPENTDLLDFLIDAFNHEISGLEGVEVWVHSCWGNPNMQKGPVESSYRNAIEIYLERLNADVWTVEAKSDGGEILEFLKPYRETMRTKIALGVVSHRTLQVESPEEVADFTRRALDSIKPENLVLTSDCGFGRQGANRLIALYKAAAISQGANIVRRELGLEERYVPIADPALQVEGRSPEQETRLFGGLVKG